MEKTKFNLLEWRKSFDPTEMTEPGLTRYTNVNGCMGVWSLEKQMRKKSIENVLPDSVIFLILLLIQTMWIVGGGAGKRQDVIQTNALHCKCLCVEV